MAAQAGCTQHSSKNYTLRIPTPAVAHGEIDPLEIDGETVSGDTARVLEAVTERVHAVNPDILVVNTSDVIDVLDETRDPIVVCDTLRARLSTLTAGEVDPASLVITQRVSKPLEEYTQRTRAVTTLERAEDRGITPVSGARYLRDSTMVSSGDTPVTRNGQ